MLWLENKPSRKSSEITSRHKPHYDGGLFKAASALSLN